METLMSFNDEYGNERTDGGQFVWDHVAGGDSWKQAASGVDQWDNADSAREKVQSYENNKRIQAEADEASKPWNQPMFVPTPVPETVFTTNTRKGGSYTGDYSGGSYTPSTPRVHPPLTPPVIPPKKPAITGRVIALAAVLFAGYYYATNSRSGFHIFRLLGDLGSMTALAVPALFILALCIFRKRFKSILAKTGPIVIGWFLIRSILSPLAAIIDVGTAVCLIFLMIQSKKSTSHSS
jgi:hypothetical protein